MLRVFQHLLHILSHSLSSFTASFSFLYHLNFLPETDMNPYGQGQWQQQGSSAPSIFGALPSAPAPRPAAALQPDSVTFQLANFKTTVLNCTVYGPGQRAAFRIVTESAPAACTIIQDNECRNIAMVKWGAHAQVEVRGYAAEQRARDWLKLSSDQRWVVSCVSTEGSHMLTANSTHSRRVMDVRGIEYAWAPMDGFICVSLLQELLAGLFSPLRQR